MCFPELALMDVRLGTATYWQGKEPGYIFVDLVRASNDAATLGFVSDSRLLNVLITRQTTGLYIIGDERCILTLGQQKEREDPISSIEDVPVVEEESAQTAGAEKPEKKSSEDRKNATVIKIFDWMRQKGRVVNVANDSLMEDYIDFPKPYVEPVEVGWGGEAAGSDEAKDADNIASDNAPAPAPENEASANETIPAPTNTSANATTPANANKDESEFVLEDRYEHEPLQDKGGEDVVTGDDEDNDDEVTSADGLESDDWAQGATTFPSQGRW